MNKGPIKTKVRSAVLVLLGSSGEVLKSFSLSRRPLSLGRMPSNTVRLNSSKVSKFHATIERTENGYEITDVGSRNGTLVNGDKISRKILEAGDSIYLGDVGFRFEEEQEENSVSWIRGDGNRSTQVIHKTSVESFWDSSFTTSRLEEAYTRLKTSLEAVQDLLQITEVSELSERLLAFTFEILEADEGVVLVPNASDVMEVQAVRSLQMREEEKVIVSDTVVEQALREKVGLVVADIAGDSIFSEARSLVLSGVRSVMCVPLVAKNKPLGVLYIASHAKIAAFSESDLNLLTAIGHGAAMALENVYMTQRLAKELSHRERLGRFLSPVLLEEVISKQVELERGGDEMMVTVMFADIRGFTSLTESTPATDIVELLNEYFDKMVEVIFQYRGILDKFIGDAIMAVWGPPMSKGEDSDRAIAAAQAMLVELRRHNHDRAEAGLDAIGVGIGLATGICVSGTIGARRRMEYTVIGDAVNLAARLSGLAKADEILCDGVTVERVENTLNIRNRKSLDVKGKAEPVQVYSLDWAAYRGGVGTTPYILPGSKSGDLSKS
ncbi:MAG: adenylate/guanylate cyclase domain-containing protein [Myxococcota bacterium]|nr:adenylate/guanylate cyclase domain-containing protein [Myxococcota bacterium]